MGKKVAAVPTRPLTNDPETWKRYWETLGQPWRTEPEINVQDQKYLQERLSITPRIKDGVYPFKDIKFKLQRAHVEWIIARYGPINWNDKQQRSRLGPDFRGADLRGLNLAKLPLRRALFGLTWNEWDKATVQEQEQATAHLEGAHLWGANLEGARCRGAHFEGTTLAHAHLEYAQFRRSHLEAADLHGIEVLNTDFKDAAMSDTQGYGPRVADVEWKDTKLTLIPWNSVVLLGDEVYAREQEQQGKPHEELVEVYRQAVRAHEQLANALQGKGIDANRFRYRGKILQRQLYWKQHAWLSWFGSMTLSFVAGYGYHLWRIIVAYGLTIIFWAVLYAVLSSPHMPILDAMLLAGTGRGLTDDASVQIWIVYGCENIVNNFILLPLIAAMVLQRIIGK